MIGAEQIKVEMTVIVSILMELVIIRLSVICGKFAGIFGVGKAIKRKISSKGLCDKDQREILNFM